VVVYESTVYPGCTEEVCVPILERVSGLKFNRDFFAGYSPERINPGDKEHRLTTIRKVTSGSTPAVAEFVDSLYRSIITVGTHKASSIRVAEAAKVIENTQRDVNIALINELALIFNRLGIDTEEVLSAAGSKWNFLPFRPGLVGGHCIGVDPVLPHAQGAGDRISPRDDPRRAAHQRQHGHLRRAAGRAAHDQGPHPGAGFAHPRDGPRLQGKLPGRTQYPDRRRRQRAREVRGSRSTSTIRGSTRPRRTTNTDCGPSSGCDRAVTMPSSWVSRTGSFARWESQRSARSRRKRHVLYDIKYVFDRDEVDGRL
jgi:UDP-N-acetyl-D-galactosamine dehydrogenase